MLKIDIKSFSRKKLEKEKLKQIRNQENQFDDNLGFPGGYFEKRPNSHKSSSLSIYSDQTKKFSNDPNASKRGKRRSASNPQESRA